MLSASRSSVWEASGPATEYGVGRDAVLVGEALLRRPDPEVELLAEVLPVPDRRPSVRVHLMPANNCQCSVN